MRGRGWPRSERRGLFDGDQDDRRRSCRWVRCAPDPPAASSARAGIELAPRAFDVDTAQASARSIVPASTIAPASSVGPSVPSVPAASICQRFAGTQLRARASVPDAYCGHRARDAAAASPSIRRPTRAIGVCSRAARATKLCATCAPHRHRNACARRSRCRGRAPCAASDCRATARFDVGDDHVPLDASVDSPASRPNNPEPITSGSSPGTSEMNSAMRARSPQQARDAAALDARQPRALDVQPGDVPARASPLHIERPQRRRARHHRAALRPGSNCRPKRGTTERLWRAGSARAARARLRAARLRMSGTRVRDSRSCSHAGVAVERGVRRGRPW